MRAASSGVLPHVIDQARCALRRLAEQAECRVASAAQHIAHRAGRVIVVDAEPLSFVASRVLALVYQEEKLEFGAGHPVVDRLLVVRDAQLACARWPVAALDHAGHVAVDVLSPLAKRAKFGAIPALLGVRPA